MVVAPVRCCHIRSGYQVPDVVLNASELGRLIGTVNLVESGSRLDSFQVIEEIDSIVTVTELNFATWVESEAKRENGRFDSFALLVILRPVRESNCLDPRSSSCKLSSKSSETRVCSSRNMVRKVPVEKVPRGLTGGCVAGYQISRVPTVSQEFESHCRSGIQNCRVGLGSERKSDYSVVSSLENTCERVNSKLGKFDGCDSSLSVDVLFASCRER